VKAGVVLDNLGDLFISLTAETASEAARLALFGMNANADARKVASVRVESPNDDEASVKAYISLNIRRDCSPVKGPNRQTKIQRS